MGANPLCHGEEISDLVKRKVAAALRLSRKRRKKYILTDSCFFYESNKKRTPHCIEIVCLKTGTVKKLKSGSIIEIVREYK